MLIKKLSKGFTLVEISVVMGMAVFFLAFVIVNVLQPQQKSSLETVAVTLLTDLRSQQLKSMVGDTAGVGTTNSNGVYFTQNSYVLFRGSSYSAADTQNFTVELPANVQMSPITFQSSQVVFSQQSGEVSNYSASFNSVVLQNIVTKETKTISINQFGVPTSN